MSPSDEPLYSEAEQRLIETIETSELWRTITKAIAWRREAELNSGMAESRREVWIREGRLSAMSDLLHAGPLLVVHYQRFMGAQEHSGEKDAMRRARVTLLDDPTEPPEI